MSVFTVPGGKVSVKFIPESEESEQKPNPKPKAKNGKFKITPGFIVLIIGIIWFLSKWLPIIASGDY